MPERIARSLCRSQVHSEDSKEYTWQWTRDQQGRLLAPNSVLHTAVKRKLQLFRFALLD